MSINANDYADTLKAYFGIDVPKMGCVMLKVEKLKTEFIVPKEWEYYAKNEDYKWIKGINAGDHITLLYGLLRNANTIRAAVDKVLSGWKPEAPQIEKVGSFPSTYKDEPYVCIVGHVKKTDNLVEAHDRLSFLPHIDSHPGYKPHVTLGYVKVEKEAEAVAAFGRRFNGTKLKPAGLDYGYKSSE